MTAARAKAGWLLGLALVAAAGLGAQTGGFDAAVPRDAAGAPVGLDPARQSEARGLLLNLDQLIMQGSREGPVYATYQTVRERMLDGKLKFIVDAKKREGNLLQSAYFSPAGASGPSWIVCDALLLDRSKQDPDLALSFLMNAIVFAEGYYSRPDNFKAIFSDHLESFFFSMDALYVQARFIRDYLKPHYPKLSEFGQFMADSLEYENMASVSMFVLGVDQQVVYGIQHLEPAIRDKSLGAKAYFAKVMEFQSEVAGKLDKAAELQSPQPGASKDDADQRDRQRYIAVISTLTLLKYGVSLINRHMAEFDKGELAKAKPDLDAFNQGLDRLSARVAPLMNGVMGYRQNLLTKMKI